MDSSVLALLVLGVFGIITAVMMFIRTKFGERFELKNTDILAALIPIAIWLVISGKVKMVEFGGFKIESAFVEASQAEIGPQVTLVSGLPIDSVTADSKRGVDEIPRLVNKGTEALSFELGHGGYYGPAIEDYLRELSQYIFFKYIIINQRDGSFFGMADARELSLASRDLTSFARTFARWLNSSDIASLSRLPRYISAENTVKEDTSKQKALELMESLNSEILPVTDKDGMFIGVVHRSRLVSSLIIDITREIE